MKMHRFRSAARSGFTLIELMITVALSTLRVLLAVFLKPWNTRPRFLVLSPDFLGFCFA